MPALSSKVLGRIDRPLPPVAWHSRTGIRAQTAPKPTAKMLLHDLCPSDSHRPQPAKKAQPLTNSHPGTPEIVTFKLYNRAVDVWALGYAWLTGLNGAKLRSMGTANWRSRAHGVTRLRDTRLSSWGPSTGSKRTAASAVTCRPTAQHVGV